MGEGRLAHNQKFVVERLFVELSVLVSAHQFSARGFVVGGGRHLHAEALAVDALDFVAPHIDGFSADGLLRRRHLERGAGGCSRRAGGGGVVPVLSHGNSDADALGGVAPADFHFLGTGCQKCCRDHRRGNCFQNILVVHRLLISKMVLYRVISLLTGTAQKFVHRGIPHRLEMEVGLTKVGSLATTTAPAGIITEIEGFFPSITPISASRMDGGVHQRGDSAGNRPCLGAAISLSPACRSHFLLS